MIMKTESIGAFKKTGKDLTNFLVGCGGFFGGLLDGSITEVVAFPTFIRKAISGRKKACSILEGEKDNSSFQTGYAFGYTLLTTPLFPLLPPLLAADGYVHLFNKNSDLAFTILGLNIGTNILSGIYELYNHNKKIIQESTPKKS